MHTKAVRQFNGKVYHNNINVGFCHWSIWLIRKMLLLFLKNILVDNEDSKTALLRGRMFAMWHFTLDGREERGDVFLTCGSAEWGCKELNAPEGACLHCLQETWEKNDLMHNEKPSSFSLFPHCDGWKYLPWAQQFLFLLSLIAVLSLIIQLN